jgi:hypothetical protein
VRWETVFFVANLLVLVLVVQGCLGGVLESFEGDVRGKVLHRSDSKALPLHTPTMQTALTGRHQQCHRVLLSVEA